MNKGTILTSIAVLTAMASVTDQSTASISRVQPNLQDQTLVSNQTNVALQFTNQGGGQNPPAQSGALASNFLAQVVLAAKAPLPQPSAILSAQDSDIIVDNLKLYNPNVFHSDKEAISRKFFRRLIQRALIQQIVQLWEDNGNYAINLLIAVRNNDLKAIEYIFDQNGYNFDGTFVYDKSVSFPNFLNTAIAFADAGGQQGFVQTVKLKISDNDTIVSNLISCRPDFFRDENEAELKKMLEEFIQKILLEENIYYINLLTAVRDKVFEAIDKFAIKAGYNPQ